MLIFAQLAASCVYVSLVCGKAVKTSINKSTVPIYEYMENKMKDLFLRASFFRGSLLCASSYVLMYQYKPPPFVTPKAEPKLH